MYQVSDFALGITESTYILRVYNKSHEKGGIE